MTELLIVVLIICLLFGASRLPKLARSLREARDEFEKGSDEAETNERSETNEQRSS